MMRQITEVADKAVSTDDLIIDDKEHLRKGILDVARLENVLAALVENKVVAIRTESEKNGSNHSSPIALLASRIHRRFQSNSTVSSEKASKHKLSVDNVRNAEEGKTEAGGRSRVGGGDGEETTLREESEKHKQAPLLEYKRRVRRNGDQYGDDRRSRDRDRSSDRTGERCWIEREPCLLPTGQEMFRPSDILEDCSVVSIGGKECVVVLERERTRTRTRRKRRRRKHHRTIIVEAMDERVKVLDPDELPQRARWTIMVTACLLLFLCLLLVGVTLRMAPLIDDMVRQENERMMHESFNIAILNNTQPMAAQRKSLDVH